MTAAIVDGVTVDTRHWIGGRRVASVATFDDVSPIDEQVIAKVARGGPAEAEAAGAGVGVSRIVVEIVMGSSCRAALQRRYRSAGCLREPKGWSPIHTVGRHRSHRRMA